MMVNSTLRMVPARQVVNNDHVTGTVTWPEGLLSKSLFPSFSQSSCLPVTIPQLSLKPTPEVENAPDALTKVAMLSEERKSKFLPLLLATTDRIFS